jgi:hypothetical protein
MKNGMTYMRKVKKALIIGNGPSRKSIDIDNVTDMTTFGCNAIYRDHSKIDYIVAMDDGMIKELHENCDCTHSTLIIPPEDERYEPHEYGAVVGRRARNNAGMIAMDEAIKRGYNDLTCIGFDFLSNSTDNMYDGTSNYGPETRCDGAGNQWRGLYFSWFLNQHPSVSFTRVRADDAFYDKGHNIPNLHFTTVSEYK